MPDYGSTNSDQRRQSESPFGVSAPQVSLPKGGGAIRGIDETFRANPATGSAGFAIPLPLSPGRSGFQPSLALSYDSGAGNGPFGLGWQLGIPSIRRRTDRGIPRYQDVNDSDTFVLAGAEDLVPLRIEIAGEWRDDERDEPGYLVRRYRPRVEDAFARIERWTDTTTGDAFWRTVTRDNVSRVYGQSAQARLADPDLTHRVFEWLLEEERDELGNVITYEYAAEDRAAVDQSLPYERGRTLVGHRCAYTYPKRIRYGNALPGMMDEYHFELVFDYGDHDEDVPEPQASRSCPVRPDAYSSFRAGFDVRCHRLCRRVLMFHRFPELGSEPALVRSIDLSYQESPVVSYLTAATQSGYLRVGAGYERESLPPVEYEYSAATIDQTVRDVAGLDDLPAGPDPRRYHWVDLDGEGIAGLLDVDGPAWHYKANEGNAAFAPSQSIGDRPSLSAGAPNGRLFDLAGDGTLDLVQYAPGVAGYQQRNPTGGWGQFQTFQRMPTVDWRDPNLRVVDLDGDGLADVLITEDEVLRWHPSEGRRGFGPASWVPRAHDEDLGPTLMFASDGGSVFLADMNGDGLPDIVRIRNGSVCYWPSRGYGLFGARIVMENAPHFDAPDQFDPGRVRLADSDGSGVIDLIYLGRDRVSIAINRSGNGFDNVIELTQFPGFDTVTDVNVADLLGDGTACLVWFSPLPQHAGRPMRYVHLMAAGKPHLLVRSVNNRGRETTLSYRSSTQFYLEDKKAGRPWVTRLPFPVHALESVEVRDRVTGWKLVTRYAYHHGYFDGEDREFRGFGMVEQLDSESFSDFAEAGVSNADLAYYQPPARTRSWFHTGAWTEGSRISRQFEAEHYAGDSAAAILPDTILPDGLSTDETREACRALKGRMLRQEVFADDGTADSSHPYSVAEHCYTLRQLQPAGDQDRGVFQVVPGETLTWHYERDPDDPRIAHALTLAHDAYGQVTCSAAVVYPRRSPELNEQSTTHIVVTESSFINQDARLEAYHLGAPSETRGWELTGLSGDDAAPFTADALRAEFTAAAQLPFDTPADGRTTQRRLIAHGRQLYRAADLAGPLPLGEIGVRAFAHESYRLVLTDGLLPAVYQGRVTSTMLESEAGYRRWQTIQQSYTALVSATQLASEDVAGWWIPSGRQEFADPTTAAQRFFLPDIVLDPFGAKTLIDYDAHRLTAVRVEDAAENVTEAVLDYRVLQPSLVTDPNDNRTAVEFDVLGRVIAQASMGKDGAGEGDTLADPTVRFEYETFRWTTATLPNRVRTYTRETHGDPTTRWLISVLYSDGSGNAAMTKTQAEPGLAPSRDATGALVFDTAGDLVFQATDPRWVGTGRIVVDNKGNTVKQYEPYFSSTDEYETETELVEYGVTPVLRYDPLGRNVQTDMPNGTVRRIEFDPWRQSTWDENDTVLESGWYAERIGGQLGADEQRAAQLTEAHAATPAVAHLDTLGRPFLAVADNAALGSYETRTRLDVVGNTLAVIDALGRTVMAYDYDMLGGQLRSSSMDSGQRWMLRDVAGTPIYGWNARDHRLRTTFDALRRPTEVFLQEGNGAELVVARTIYGELQSGAEASNLRGRVYQAFDSAGVATTGRFDFEGNLLTSTRQLAAEYKSTLDWSVAVALEAESWNAGTTYDALGRPVTLTTPDGSAVRPAYNDAALLERIDVTLGGTTTTFVANIDYNAKGQRELIDYGNGVQTVYEYDPLTFRLANLQTSRGAERLQDLRYIYDPVGNVTHIRDDAQQTVYFNNQVAEPNASYTYDALYRLIGAEGREHAGNAGQPETTWSDEFRVNLPHPHDGGAMRPYTEAYSYDAAGNILKLVHQAIAGSWTRDYEYDETSSIESGMVSNRLSRTVVGSVIEGYTHDMHGSMTAMPHLSVVQWNHLDQLAATARQAVTSGTPETTYYVYDAGGQRVRKVTERQAASGATATRLKERIYLGGFEVFREYDGAGATITLERETLHVVDGQRRVALVETRTLGDDGSPPLLVRFQLGNYLGSASLELDRAGVVIAYEEYYAYGSTSYQGVDAGIRAAAKRYRYTGKERDEETGLAYHAARYYACWLARWTSADPDSLGDGPNVYMYAHDRPTTLIDNTGRGGEVPPEHLRVETRPVWRLDQMAQYADFGDDFGDVIHASSREEQNANAAKRAHFVREQTAVAMQITTAQTSFVGALRVGEGLLLNEDPVHTAIMAAGLSAFTNAAVGMASAGRGPSSAPRVPAPILTPVSSFVPLDSVPVIQGSRLTASSPDTRKAATSVILKIPTGDAREQAIIDTSAARLGLTRRQPVVNLAQLARMPEVEEITHITLDAHGNPNLIAEMRASALQAAIRATGARPASYELVACYAGAECSPVVGRDFAFYAQATVKAPIGATGVYRSGEVFVCDELPDGGWVHHPPGEGWQTFIPPRRP